MYYLNTLNNSIAMALFYGNCQMVALHNMLSPIIGGKYHVYPCRAVHLLTNDDITYIHNILHTIDLLITQPISDNYKNNSDLSTKTILSKLSTKCKIIMIPNCYFNFYYPFVTYLKTVHKEYTEYYFDLNLIQILHSTDNKDDIVTLFFDCIDKCEYPHQDKLAEASISELHKREIEMCAKYNNIYCITISQFIKDNYKDHLLFYTRNHPTNYLLAHICKSILHYIHIYDIPDNSLLDDPFVNKHPPLYKSLQKYVNFDISKYTPSLFDANGLFEVTKKLLNSLDKFIYPIKN